MIEGIALFFAGLLVAFGITNIWRALVRDFFAWTIWQQDYKYINDNHKIHRPNEMAHWAYKMADEMMNVRNK